MTIGRLYLDSSALIHFIERRDHMQARIGATLASVVEGGESVVLSEIGVAECLYGAYKVGSAELESRYLEVFANSAIFDIFPVDGERLEAAAKLGARKGIELVDAVHFAAAIERRCQVFLTDDERIRSSDGVTVVRVSAL
jgi:predicted nucleic acid-binding protein